MSIINKMLIQDAVYWAPAGKDKFGKTVFSEPIEIRVRWEDEQVQITNRQGIMTTSQSVVYVSQDVDIEGVLFLGELSSAVNVQDPLSNDKAGSIKVFNKLPDIRGKLFLRTAYL